MKRTCQLPAAPADGNLPDRPMKQSVFVVYPAALFDGWEVVKECDDNPAFFGTREEAISYAEACAVMNGGAVVKLENWFGATDRVWEVRP